MRPLSRYLLQAPHSMGKDPRTMSPILAPMRDSSLIHTSFPWVTGLLPQQRASRTVSALQAIAGHPLGPRITRIGANAAIVILFV